ncbi:MAG: Rieske 2Fe-2S domain-containing protein [Caulobacteraceae bacterium]
MTGEAAPPLAADGRPMVRAAALADLAPGRPTLVKTPELRALLCRVDDEVYALSPFCTHARVVLAAETLTPDGLIECPMHGAMFSPRDGAVCVGPATVPLPTFETRIVDGAVYVAPPDPAAAQPSFGVPGQRPWGAWKAAAS